MQARILIYVQHLLGIGHLRRAAVLARTLAARGAEVLCVSGGMPVANIDLGNATLVQLPPARIQGLDYKRLFDQSDAPVDADWCANRCAMLLRTVSEFAPDTVVTETFPFGRRLLRFELEALLEQIAASPRRIRLACSIRDILEGFPGPEGRMQQVVEQVNEHYALVLVHSDPHWVALADTFPGADQIADRVRYTGYVSGFQNRVCQPELHTIDADHAYGSGEIVVSTGGGVVGEDLALAAIGAGRLALTPHRWRVLVGHNLPQHRFQALASMAGGQVCVERNRADFNRLLTTASVSVSQAGYNTVAELLGTRTPAVIVPFTAPGQFEQRRRAQLLAARGRVIHLAADRLEPGTLVTAVSEALSSQLTLTTGKDRVRLDGAARTADLLLELGQC